MSIIKLVGKINAAIEGKESETAFIDLGARYTKCIVKETEKIKNFFIEETSGDKTASAISILKKNHFSSANVHLCLKGPDTIARYITFPKMEKSNLKQSFLYEVGKHIPFPPDSVYFDVFVVEEDYSKTESLILLAAAKKEIIDPLVEAFNKERITVSGITLATIALTNLFFATSGNEGNSAIIDLGSSSTTLNLMKKNIPYLSREIKIAGKNFIKKLATVKNIDLREAENLFVTAAKPEELLEIGEEVLSGIAEEIRSSFDYFEMNTAEQIQNIFLTGGFAGLTGIEKIMGAALGIDVKPWQPWEKIPWQLPDSFKMSKHIFSTAMGLTV